MLKVAGSYSCPARVFFTFVCLAGDIHSVKVSPDVARKHRVNGTAEAGKGKPGRAGKGRGGSG